MIVITGASSGIGAALARPLAGPGRALALLASNGQRLAAVAAACAAKGATWRIANLNIMGTDRLAI